MTQNELRKRAVEARRQVTKNGIDPGRVKALTIGLVLECVRFGSRRQADLSTVQTDADKDQLGLLKYLIPRRRGKNKMANIPQAAIEAAKALTDIERIDYGTQDWLRSRIGLPSCWQAGIHRIPVAAVPEVEEELKRRREARKEPVARFVKAYPGLRDAMRGPLGSQYREEDWPSPQTVAARFSFSWRWFELDAVPNRLDDIDKAAAATMRALATAQQAEIAVACRRAMRAYALEVVKEVQHRLTPKAGEQTKKFRQSTILAGVSEFMRTYPLRDVTDDKDLALALKELEGITAGADLDAIKGDAELQAAFKKSIDSVVTNLDALLVDADSREIALE